MRAVTNRANRCCDVISLRPARTRGHADLSTHSRHLVTTIRFKTGRSAAVSLASPFPLDTQRVVAASISLLAVGMPIRLTENVDRGSRCGSCWASEP
jgi:hypothetical protein